MTEYKITLVIDDSNADEETDPLTTAVSNLEHEGYDVIYTRLERTN